MSEAKTNVPDIIWIFHEVMKSMFCIKSHTIKITISEQRTNICAISPCLNSLNAGEESILNLSLILLISEMMSVLVGIFMVRMVPNNDIILSDSPLMKSLQPLLAK